MATKFILAPEARKEIAHGKTVGMNFQNDSSSGRNGRNWIQPFFFRLVRGFVHFGFETHDFIVGYYRSPLRGFRRRGSVALPLIAILFLAVAATAQTTNGLSEAEIQGRNLAKKLCEMRPIENFTNTGVLEIRNNGTNSKFPFSMWTSISNSEVWTTSYLAKTEVLTNRVQGDWLGIREGQKIVHGNWLRISHEGRKISYNFAYFSEAGFFDHSFGSTYNSWSGSNYCDICLSQKFADSDFSIGDFGLEFFHWPNQKIIKKEFARGRGCMVLESTNPNPSPGGYSKVDCWIDEETLGIVEAKAYDANGKLLKEFQPKSFKKVNGQWELKDMEIRNVQTGSRTRIEFDLKQ